MKKERKNKPIDQQVIVNVAITLAGKTSWEALRLYQVAEQLNIPLDELQKHYKEKDQIADAWLEHADTVMLECAKNQDILSMNTHERLFYLIVSWLSSFDGRRQVTRQIIIAKCEPGHLHVSFPALLGVSRTVQWIREAAQRDSLLPMRAIEEVGLSSIFLLTLRHWLHDCSEDSTKTKDYLHRLLNQSASVHHGVQVLKQYCCKLSNSEYR